MKEKLLSKLKQIKDLRILVLGDAMLDIYDFCYTATSRPSPEKSGKKVYTSHRALRTLGGAGNVALNLSTLGVSTSLMSITGHDGHYFTLKKLCEDNLIKHFFVQDENRPTCTKFRLYIDDEYQLRRDDECTDKISPELEATVKTEFLRVMNECDAVIISDYNKGFFTKELAQTVISKCNKNKIPVIVDFKPDNKSFFASSDVIAPNSLEAKALLPEFNEDNGLEKNIRKLHDLLQCKNTVVTLRDKGICGFDGKTFYHIAAHKVSAVDAVGCGDTVRVGLAIGFALKLGLEASLNLANAAAATVVQKTGTAAVTLEELQNFINTKI